MKQILTIALTTFREYLRERIVWICGFISILLFAFSGLLGALSFSEKIRILLHFGLLAIHLGGLAIVVLVGANVLNREMERQTCLLVLARPLSRAQFLIGKTLGIFLLLNLIGIILSGVLFILLGAHFPIVHLFQILYGIMVEQSVLLSLAFMASIFLRPSIAILLTGGAFLIGNWIQEFGFFARKVKNEFFIFLSTIVDYIFPNFYQMNWRSIYFAENGVHIEKLLWVTLHGFSWTFFFLSVAVILFRRKDLV